MFFRVRYSTVFRHTNFSNANLSFATKDNIGISEGLERDLIRRGAIFEDSPGDRSSILTPVQ
ncbi:MAG TPA: hypothetical protein VK203_02315 [Nostocaceae cyanobacterium]|nr:hypothetical protein [Nostocaceae cyanobacterium]